MRKDLSPGLQVAQAVHAAFHFSQQHPVLVTRWLNASNFLVVVAIPDEAALRELISAAGQRGITAYAVREPDLGDEITAAALEPDEAARRLCASLPLALREAVMT